MRFAGANRPIYLISKNQLVEFSPDKHPIGGHLQEKKFITCSQELHDGESIYLFSDGYVDQFGGAKGKKFMTKQFKDLLLSIQEKSMSEQEIIIRKTFEEWKSSREQVDDVLVIGIRI